MGPKSRNMHTHITADVVTSHGDKMFVRFGDKCSLGYCMVNTGFQEQGGYLLEAKYGF